MESIQSIPVSRLTSQITLRVTGIRSFGIRMKIGSALIKLAARVMGVGLIIAMNEDERPK